MRQLIRVVTLSKRGLFSSATSAANIRCGETSNLVRKVSDYPDSGYGSRDSHANLLGHPTLRFSLREATIAQTHSSIREHHRRLLLTSLAKTSLTDYLPSLNCWTIGAVLIIFVILSCFLGLFFTLRTEYGYSMGDSFTLAGYVVAVGALISSFLLALHYPRCTCWNRERYEAGIEMGPIF